MMTVLGVCLAGACVAGAEAFPEIAETNAPTEAAYAPSAFPDARRAEDRARLQDALAQARARGLWMDERLRDAFAARPRSHVGRVRVSKRRLLRVRALQFAARFLERDDATGFGFAERALKDAEELAGGAEGFRAREGLDRAEGPVSGL